jgi:hypothetical protein
MTIETQPTISNEDQTFARLKRADYKTVESKVSNNLTVNPYTFRFTLHHLYHQIVIDCGWTVEEFLKELNYRLFQ